MGMFDAVTDIIGGVTGGTVAKEAAAEANAIKQKNLDMWKYLLPPDITEQEVELEAPELKFQYTPEQEEAVLLGNSAHEGISTDPIQRQAQMQALASIKQQLGSGVSPEEINQLRGLNRGLGQNIPSTNEAGLGNAIQSDMIARKQLMPDGDEVANLMNNRIAQKLAGLNQLGSQSLSLDKQNFNEQINLARNKDKFGMANTQESMDVAGRNTNRTNEAMLNLAKLKQGAEDQRASIANQQQIHNKSLLQQDFENKKTRLEGLTGQYQGQAKNMVDSAAAKSAGKVGLLDAAISTGATAYANKKPTTAATKEKEYGSTSTMPAYAQSGYTGEGYGT